VRVAAHRDLVVLQDDVYPAGASEHGLLVGDVRRRLPRPGQPLRQTGVEAAGHWILADAERRDERPHLRFAALAARGGVGPTMPSSVSPNLARSGRHALKAERHDLSTRPELGMRVPLIMEI